VFLHKLIILFQECHFAVLLLLVLNVSLNIPDIRFTDRKSAIASLPGEFHSHQILLVYPMRRFAFDVFQYILHGVVWIKEEEDMDMVGGSIKNAYTAIEVLSKMALDMFMQGTFNFRTYEWRVVFGSANRVKPDFR
jgi:hypothetical protein